MNTLSDGVATLVEHLRALAESIVGLRVLRPIPSYFGHLYFLSFYQWWPASSVR